LGFFFFGGQFAGKW